jgi:hypothetical protein
LIKGGALTGFAPLSQLVFGPASCTLALSFRAACGEQLISVNNQLFVTREHNTDNVEGFVGKCGATS